MAAEKHASKGQAWFCATGLPSDIVIEVYDMSFHLHKFPLTSKSQKLDQLIAEQGRKSSSATVTKQKRRESGTGIEEEEEEEEEYHEEQEEEEENPYRISLPDFPGGSEAFETAAKFCYGIKIDLSSYNVVPLRCAAEFLEMTDDFSENNLLSKTERFLSQSVFESLKESIKALKSCESVMPLAESLGIVQRLIDSIASRVSSTDPTLFGRPVNDGIIEVKGASSQALWNGIETGLRRKTLAQTDNVESWFEDLALLSLPLFKRLISTLKTRYLRQDIIESCLICYAKMYIPGTSRSNRKPSSLSVSAVSESEQRELLETIISNLPLEKSPSESLTATRFLFDLLRTANILNASESSKAALEKKIGFQLEQVTLDDLLIPSYSHLNETLYDVDCIERILGYFLEGLEDRKAAGIEAETGDNTSSNVTTNIDNSGRPPALMLVGKLIDGYLSEIASDANLHPEKFYNLAISLPDQARNFDDGLYRAVDLYLKAHPSIPESEREKICRVFDCQKLTLEACTHAAQNERLPLRAVVQVLFFEQLQLRQAIAGTLFGAESAPSNAGRLSEARREEEDEEDEEERVSRGEEESSTWRETARENQVLRLDMDSMRTRVHQLERECATMKKVIQKIEKEGTRVGCWIGSLNKRLGCKFKSQVCDSHESAIAKTRRGRHHPSHHHHLQ